MDPTVSWYSHDGHINVTEAIAHNHVPSDQVRAFVPFEFDFHLRIKKKANQFPAWEIVGLYISESETFFWRFPNAIKRALHLPQCFFV